MGPSWMVDMIADKKTKEMQMLRRKRGLARTENGWKRKFR